MIIKDKILRYLIIKYSIVKADICIFVFQGVNYLISNK